MENQAFVYSDKQRFIASSSIISCSIEPEQDSNEFSANTEIVPCPSCGSTLNNVVQKPASCHFGAIRCGQCDRFLRWQAKPENLDIQKHRQATIAALLESPQLSQWERAFLQGLQSKKLSPKQQEVLSRIEVKVGGQG